MPKQVKDIPGCQGCPMAAKYPTNSFVPPDLIGYSTRLIVAEAPGQVESLMGKPLVGSSGKIAATLYSKAGIKFDDCSKVNVINCRPPNNIFPDSSEARSYCTKAEGEKIITHCLAAHTLPVVESRHWDLGKWKRIDLLGEKATRYVGQREGGISRWRGSIINIPGITYAQNIAVPTMHPAAVMRDWSMGPIVISDLKKTLVVPPQSYNLFPSLAEVAAFKSQTFALDIETNTFTSQITLVGLCDKACNAIVIPFKGPYIAEIRRIIQNASEIITQNGVGFDMPTLERNGIKASPTCQIQDTMLGHALVCPDMPHDLGFIASQFTNVQSWKHTAEDNKEHYNATDVDVTMQIWSQLRALLKQFNLWDTYRNVSVPAAMICHEMKRVGLKLDHRKVNEVRERIKKEQEGLEATLPASLKTHQISVNKRVLAVPGTLGKSGKPVKYLLVASSETVTPWRSDKSVGEWLYGSVAQGGLGLPEQKQIKTGKRTTDKIALAKLAKTAGANSEAIRAIMRLRALDELLTTFAKKDYKYSDTLHANFNVHGTSQGRLSSSHPNMQNWPEEARCIVIPHFPDWRIMSFDFSQLENRLTATLAHDTDRLQRFAADPDFNEHAWAASVIFDLEYSSIQKDNDKDAPYGRGKRINHGTAYRMGPRKIATMYDLVEREVKQQQSKLLARLSKTIAWQDAVAEEAKSKGLLTNAFGRKRWFNTPNFFTEAASFHAQSCGADIILRCMIGLLYERVGISPAQARLASPVLAPIPKQSDLLVQVHDNLTFQYHPAVEAQLYRAVMAVMTQPWSQLAGFSCPVSCESGLDWGPAAKYGSLTKFKLPEVTSD